MWLTLSQGIERMHVPLVLVHLRQYMWRKVTQQGGARPLHGQVCCWLRCQYPPLPRLLSPYIPLPPTTTDVVPPTATDEGKSLQVL